MRLKDKVAIVTGGASGIGAAVAERFAAEGATVVVADLSAPSESLQSARTPRIHTLKLDVSDPAAVARAAAGTLAAFKRIDVLVNSAGIGANIPFLDTPIETVDRIYSVNVKGTFLMSQAAARAMVKSGGGRIINLGSVSGLRGNLGRAAYGASKGAITILTQVMAVELAPHGILVNAIAPGPIETPMVRQMNTPEHRRQWSDRLPLARYGGADEVAATALFLASDESSYITGAVIPVDGGFLASGVIARAPA